MSKMVYVDIYTLEDSVHLKVSGLKKNNSNLSKLEIVSTTVSLCRSKNLFFE